MTYPEHPDDSSKWTVAEAKAKFSEMIDRAQTRRAQLITRNGRPTVVVVSVEEWEAKSKRRGSLVDFLAASPLAGLEIERKKDRPKPVRL